MPDRNLSKLEVEAKFRLDNSSVTSRILLPSNIAPGYSLGPIYIKTNVDTYYDTDDMALYLGGYALRVRKTVSSSMVTLKTVKSAHTDIIMQRLETERYVNGDLGTAPYLDQLPVEISALIGSMIAVGESVQPVLSLFQERSKRMIYFVDSDANNAIVDNRQLAEMSLDNVWVLKNSAVDSVVDANMEEAVYQFTELEYELFPNSKREAFDQFIGEISKLNLVEPSLMSKYEVGLRAIGRIKDKELGLHP